MSRRLTQPEIDRARRLCELHSMATVAGIMGLHRRTIGEAKARGWKAYQQSMRPRPSDFALLANTMRKKDLMAHYRAGDKVVRRWAAEVARERVQIETPGRVAQPIPADLAHQVETLGPYGAAAHYGVHYNTVKRWRKAAGLPFSWSRRPRYLRKKKPVVGWADSYFSQAAG